MNDMISKRQKGGNNGEPVNDRPRDLRPQPKGMNIEKERELFEEFEEKAYFMSGLTDEEYDISVKAWLARAELDKSDELRGENTELKKLLEEAKTFAKWCISHFPDYELRLTARPLINRIDDALK